MRKSVLMMIMGISLCVAGTSFAAKFDMWETGIDINEVVTVAKKYNIPIADRGLFICTLDLSRG